MAQALLYIKAIYILLSVLYSTSNASTGCPSVTVETSDKIVNANQNFTVFCKTGCGFLNHKVMYSGDPATGTPPSGIVDLSKMGKKSIIYNENLTAYLSITSDHSNFQDCDDEVSSINSTLCVKAPSPGIYYFHCYTEPDYKTCYHEIYSMTKEVKVLRDVEVSTPKPNLVSSTITTTTSISSTTSSSLHIVTATISTCVGTSSSQGGNTIESIMPTQTSSLNSIQVSTIFLTNIVTSTSTMYISSHCTAVATTTASSITTSSITVQDPLSNVQPSQSNNLYQIEKEIMIGTVSVVGFLLLLAMIGTLIILMMACKFTTRIRSQSKLMIRNRNLTASTSSASSNENMAFINPMVVQHHPPLPP